MNVKLVVLNNLSRNINVCVLTTLRVNVVGILRKRIQINLFCSKNRCTSAMSISILYV